ncbi:hypothetical protein EWM64_g9396, partial [Hericium alpestre]
MWHLHIYYRRTRRRDVPLITDILLLDSSTRPPDPDSWTKASRSLRDGVYRTPSLYLWYRTGKTLGDMSTEERAELITEVDVLYGDGQPWFGFEKLSPPTMDAQGRRKENTWLTIRRGVKNSPALRTVTLLPRRQVQNSPSRRPALLRRRRPCRDVPPDFTCEPGAYSVTASLLSRTLDLEKPDLVVFTGDQLNGQGTSWDAKSVLAKFSAEVAKRQIPWAAVFGNHDDEDARATGSRRDQVKMMQALPYSLVEAGPEDIHGVGNYVLKVFSADASKTQLLTLYFLDSGSYSKGFIDWFGFFMPTEYDWIRQNQIDWFLQESASVPVMQRPFTPDTGKDFGDVWRRQASGQLTPEQGKIAKPNALMFFHMPLILWHADLDPATGRLLDVGEHDLERSGAAKTNGGLFEKGLLKATESDHTASGSIPEVKVVGNGHCHVTENCRRVKGVWLCFGGGGSYQGYSKVGFDRRFRVYDISDYGETIRTYKRLDTGDIIDEMTLQVASPPKQLQPGKGRPPSSPLLHTRFQRTSTGTTSSYNTFNASFDRSIGDECLRDDESVYSTPTSPPAHRQLYPNPWDGGLRASEYEPGRASDDADRGQYYSGVPSMMEYRESWQSDGTVRHQPEDIATATGPNHGLWTQGRPRRSSDSQHIDPFVFETQSIDRQQDQPPAVAAVPTVVISSEPDPAAAHDSPFPSPSSMGSASSRAGRVPSAVPLAGDTNFSRPRRPKDVPSDAETKRAVIERNSHRTHAATSLRTAATSTYSPSLASSATSLASHSNTSLASRSHPERPEMPRS